MRIREIAQARVRYGYRKIRVLLNREGWDVGKYLVYRPYTEESLSMKRMKPAGKREAVAIEVGQSLKGDDVVRVLNRIKAERPFQRCCSVTTGASSPIRRWIYGLIETERR
jgi:putative transposase